MEFDEQPLAYLPSVEKVINNVMRESVWRCLFYEIKTIQNDIKGNMTKVIKYQGGSC